MIWKNIKYLWKHDLRELLKSVVDNTLDELDKTVGEDIGQLISHVKRIDSRIKALEDMDGNFKHLDQQIHSLFERVEALEERIEELSPSSAHYRTLDRFERRIIGLEETIEAMFDPENGVLCTGKYVPYEKPAEQRSFDDKYKPVITDCMRGVDGVGTTVRAQEAQAYKQDILQRESD